VLRSHFSTLFTLKPESASLPLPRAHPLPQPGEEMGFRILSSEIFPGGKCAGASCVYRNARASEAAREVGRFSRPWHSPSLEHVLVARPGRQFVVNARSCPPQRVLPAGNSFERHVARRCLPLLRNDTESGASLPSAKIGQPAQRVIGKHRSPHRISLLFRHQLHSIHLVFEYWIPEKLFGCLQDGLRQRIPRRRDDASIRRISEYSSSVSGQIVSRVFLRT